MGSVASTNSGLSDLLQTLSNENSPLLATISSPTIEAALQNAPAGDIAQISDEALQLQVADEIFGNSTTSSTPSDSLFSELTSGATGSSSSTASAPSLADQLAAYQSNAQIQEAQTLLGISQPTTTPNSQFDVFA
jgi:midasin (ATPase involved in ribosome maturation)